MTLASSESAQDGFAILRHIACHCFRLIDVWTIFVSPVFCHLRGIVVEERELMPRKVDSSPRYRGNPFALQSRTLESYPHAASLLPVPLVRSPNVLRDAARHTRRMPSACSVTQLP